MPLATIIFKASLFFLWCLVMVPPQAILILFYRGPHAYHIPYLWHKGICLIFGLRVRVEGAPIETAQTLFVSNHVSYLDIPVIGSTLKASFVAKNEVAGWPVFGFLSRMQQTAFISRSRNHAQREKNALGNMLKEGKSLILFPEGTSTDGRDVASFKSSLFSMTLDGEHPDLLIQPFTLRIDRVDGKSPDDQAVRDLFAWYGDMTMPPHLRAFTAGRGADVTLVFHSPIRPNDYPDRKSLAEACESAVRSGLTGAKIATGLAA
jgi:1-acyl-sn-glycerol-3-phosphate acyltransferase